MKKLLEKVRAFLWRWQELLVWLPVAFCLVWASYQLIPLIDPRAGLDGFGEIYTFLVQVFKANVVFFLAWLFKRTYLHDVQRWEERAMHARCDLPENRYQITKDRLEWLGLLVIIAWMTGA